MVLLGYWQLGNRQMFFNSPAELVNAKDVVDSAHTFFHSEDGLSHIYLLILMIPTFMFFKWNVHKLQRVLYCLKLFKPNEHFDQDWNLTINLDEDIGKYWECIPGMRQKRWFAQVTHLKEHLQINTITEVAVKNLGMAKRGKKYISNIHNYDIL